MPHNTGCCEHKRAAFTHGEPSPSYAPHHHIKPVHLDIALTVNIDAKEIIGVVATRVRASVAGRHTLVLDACNFLDVTVRDEASRPVVHRYDGSVITVVWNDEWAVDEKRVLIVNYRVVDPITGAIFSTPDAAYPNRPRFMATDNETERARYYLPCVDKPGVTTTFNTSITAGKLFTIVAPGVPQNETIDEAAGTKTATFKLEQPCPSYLYCMGVGDYRVQQDKPAGPIPITYYAPKDISEEALAHTFKGTPEIMHWLTNRVGVPYPFPVYRQLVIHNMGGAMENITCTTWDSRFVTDTHLRDFQDMYTFLVNVHEMTHSYFGDALVVRHFEHVWSKESWATYMESVWCEEHWSQDAFRCYMLVDAEAYMDECASYVRPIVTRVFNHSWSMFDNHTYPGGAWRIHMLRKKMGDAAFWAAIKEYLTTYLYSHIETDDFRRVLERHCGFNLTKFFDQWFYSRGYPKVTGALTFDLATNWYQVSFEQTQVDTKSQIGLFDFELEVVATDSTGEVHRGTATFGDSNKATVQFTMKGPLAKLAVDPEGKVLFSLSMNSGEDVLRATMSDALTDSVTRIRCARELIRLGTSTAMAGVGAATFTPSERPFIAKALAGSPSRASLDLLARMVLNEDATEAMNGVLLAANLRDATVAAAVREFIAKKADAQYRPLARALEALGEQRDDADLPTLMQYASHQGQAAVVRRGALVGLGKSRGKDAWAFLGQRINYGAEEDIARPMAIDAFAAVSNWQDKLTKQQAIEALVPLTRDPYPGIRKAAVRGLVTLRASSASDAVEAVRGTLPNQDHPWLDGQLRALGKVDAEVAALKQEAEELKERVRKLEAAAEKK